MSFSQITVEDLAQCLDNPNIQFVDVREPWEVEMASLKPFQNLPLSQFSEWAEQIYSQLDPETETLVLCHHGVRSAQMCHWLTQQGFTNVKNISGGIDAYSIVVDRSVPRY
ncbi:rhodanese-like protein [Leptolyngbya boryana NIES-2135]|jgi:rhodanese-related sulfurtransferase|uniref:Rhodanese-like protein n=1 Tax=Leptolyngbya boryana NIES-2135 TaxID=1973484 RepID=A0A1Z4JMS0_LEPBY|nr:MULTISPECIES: rhodanese-like domain-containing protein [Leptolyngbya]BAY58000.1 rhodanese-like protein [Leptolyngbya boryana NIES-2135]MBD1856237.1 rhodanese-related sulfurtransferase [Leptolyngbya sp. FACHB-1624]MBD2367444.1 rhodanese-related sulfurtransferase [Leptolyngbya sp. FACHB-161]MBD2373968.1 rhodanese-related sulfurtransferase [Leptolyngbya sp. FACHB-238]MBD2398232.1 rhodanese-related sulfurtransferase [Leptolyngbya sp. FACHB-239]